MFSSFFDSEMLKSCLRMIEMVSSYGYLPLFLKRPLLFPRLITMEGRLDATDVLKLCSYFHPYIENDHVVEFTTQTVCSLLIEQQTMSSLAPLMDSILVTMIPTLEEKPIYSYQYMSFSTFNIKERKMLCNLLARNLATHSQKGTPGLMTYAASPLCKVWLEGVEWNWASVKRADALICLKVLWKYHKFVPDYTEQVLTQLKAICADHPTYEELFHASKFCQISISTKEHMSLFMLQKQIHQTVMKLVNSAGSLNIEKAEYAFPTLQNLGVSVDTVPELMGVVSAHVIPKLHFRSMYGEPLFHNLIYAIETLKNPDLAIEGVPNLTFIPSDSVDPEVVRRLFVSLAVLQRTHMFNIELLIPLVVRYGVVLDTETISSSLPILKPLSEHLSEEIQQVLTRVGAKPENAQSVESSPEDDLSELLAIRVFKPMSLNQHMQVIEAVTQRNHAHEAINKMLDYAVVVGNSTNVLQFLMEKLDKFDLWNELSLSSVTNLLLLHLESKTLKATVQQRVLQLFTEKAAMQSNSEDGFVKNPISEMVCYLPFSHSSVLEPRRILSNAKSNFAVEPEDKTRGVSQIDEELLLKMNAVINGFGLPNSNDLKKSPRKPKTEGESAIKEFSEIFSRIVKSNKKLLAQYQDKETGWVIDLALPATKLAIVFHEDTDQVMDATGSGISSTLLSKLAKEQLKENGWDVVGVKRQKWGTISMREKEYLVRHIANKS